MVFSKFGASTFLSQWYGTPGTLIKILSSYFRIIYEGFVWLRLLRIVCSTFYSVKLNYINIHQPTLMGFENKNYIKPVI